VWIVNAVTTCISTAFSSMLYRSSSIISSSYPMMMVVHYGNVAAGCRMQEEGHRVTSCRMSVERHFLVLGSLGLFLWTRPDASADISQCSIEVGEYLFSPEFPVVTFIFCFFRCNTYCN
jgi:hypothetical protein